MTLDQPRKKRPSRLALFVPVLAIMVLLIVALLRTGPGPETPRVSAEVRPPVQEVAATGVNPRGEALEVRLAPGKGDLEIQFDLAFNTRFCAMVMQENAVEARQWVRLVADPRTDPQNHTPKNAKIGNLSPGPKRLLLASSTGFIERKLDITIRERETTVVRVNFATNPFKTLSRLEGKVVDTQGKPVSGARVTVETEDVERIGGTSGLQPFELFSEEVEASALLHLHGPGEDAQPYSEEYLGWLLHPASYRTAETTLGRRVFSDGRVNMYYITSESGQFHFEVKVAKPHVVTAEYQGVDKVDSVSPGEILTMVLPLEAASLLRFQDHYERAMRGMLLKDQVAVQEVHRALGARARGAKAAAKLKSVEANFDEATRSPCDFQDRDLSRRNAFISRIRKVAYQIATELSLSDKEPGEKQR